MLATEHVVLCERSEVPHLMGEALRLEAAVATHPDESLALLERSLSVLAGAESRLQEAQARVADGAAPRRTGRRREAREMLAQGHRLAQECHALALVDLASTELAGCGLRVHADQSASFASLTASERRVAELAAAGHSNPEIARALFLSLKTVETHLSRTYRKLQIPGRAQLPSALPPEPEPLAYA